MIFEEAWLEVATYAGGLLAGAALFLLKRVRQAIYARYLKMTGKHPNHPDPRSFDIDRTIYGLLVELRTGIQADRTCLFQFHNGSVFSSSKPIWRISCTHESSRAGISHELNNLQSLLASSLFELLEPLFNQGKLHTGVTEFTDDSGQRCYGFSVHDLHESFLRSMLITQGVKYLFISPIELDGGIVGFVSINFCSDMGPEYSDISEPLSKSTAQIEYELRRNR